MPPKQMRSASETVGKAEAEGVPRQFEEAVERVREWKGSAVKPNDQLVLYGLYKQASFGDCSSQRPGLFDPTGRAKWDSWKSYEGVGEVEAMQRYCRVAAAVCPPGTAADRGENHADARTSIENTGHVNGHLNGDLSGGDGPARACLSLHDSEARGHIDGERAREVSATADSSSVPLLSRDSLGSASVVATGGTIEPQSMERRRRRVGKGEDRLAARVDGCSPEPLPAGTFASTQGSDECGGPRVAVVAKVAAVVVVVLSIAAVQGGGNNHMREEGGLEVAGGRGGGVGEGSAYGWRVLLLLLVSTSAVVAILLTAAAGCLWCAVRVARWREEIFAGSPVVAEVVARAATLDRNVTEEKFSSPPVEPSVSGGSSGNGEGCTGGGGRGSSGGRRPFACSGGENGVDDDPVGHIFRPGTRASHDFYPPCLDTETASTRGDISSATAAPVNEPSTAPTLAENGDGSVVFMTGVTGLVGQMVLFDLLRQGAAAKRLASAADDDNLDECWRGALTSRGLRRVVVLVRGKKGVRPSDRLASIRDSPMFRPLRESGAWVDDVEAGMAAEVDDPGTPSTSSSSPCTDVKGLRLQREIGRGAGTVVTAVEGELGKEGLGLAAEARALLAGAGVTHALHCAASVSFSDPLAEAAATNVTGALRVAALVASWPSCGTLVHVSTAFVHGGNSGTASSPLPQQLPDLGGRNPERLYRSAQNSSVVGVVGGGDDVQSTGGPGKEAVEAMADLGYPNTYTFTKALGEHLLARALSAHNRKLDKYAAEGDGDQDGGERGARAEETGGYGASCSPGPRRLRLRVVRPSIVGPSWVFPWPGWTGEQPSTVTGCQVLVLQRAVKTFRLGPHPAPIIPVDVVSRAIVHSALGWGGPLTAAASADDVAVVDPVPRQRPRDLPGTSEGGGGPAASCCPSVTIRNLAWATRSVVRGGGTGAAAPRKRGENGDGDVDCSRDWGDTLETEPSGNGTTAGRTPPKVGCLEASDEAAVADGEGRMPSFREIAGLLYDYAVLRGLRPSFEALAMTSSFAAASVLPAPVHAMSPGVRAQGNRGGVLPPYGGRNEQPPLETSGSWKGRLGLRASSRLVFDAMHVLLDRSPVWALQGGLSLANWVERLGGFGCGNRRGGGYGDGGTKGGGGAGATSVLRRLDKLAALPAVYEAFTWRQYVFDSALRVPGDLAPEGYALETALASELLQQSLPGGAAVGARASPERRRALLRELALQIETHRSGGLRCGGSGVGGLGRAIYGADTVSRSGSANGGDDAVADPRNQEEKAQRSRGDGDLSLLCGRADRLVPWPALAWWAATIPGSAARGGVTVWVRLVAFAVRVVMSRAASVVAVDSDSFRTAAPPGHRARVSDGVSVGSEGGSGRQRRGGEALRGLRRDEDTKEDGEILFGDHVANGADSGGDETTRATIHQEKGCGVVHEGGGAIADARGELSWQRQERRGAARKTEGDGERGAVAGGTAENVVVVLLPTHRSYLDFVLVSLFCASMRSFPGLSWLRVPKVAAADGPFGKEGTPLRWLMEKLGAFFIRRGNTGEPRSVLQQRLELLQEDHASGQGAQSCRNRSRGETSGVTPNGISVAARLEEEQVKAKGSTGNRDRRPETRSASDGNWPGPRESDPRQKGLETLEVFVEGTRSRDRRFLAPKTGLIRALQGAREGATLWLVPVSISYERVPEQATLAEDLLAARELEGSKAGGHKRRQHQHEHVGAVGLTGLLRWTMKALSGRVRLGRVLMRAEDPVVLRPGGDVKAALLEVRQRHRLGTVVTPYHIREAGDHLGLGIEDVHECVQELGGTVWYEDDDQDNPFARRRGSVEHANSTQKPPVLPLRYASDIPSAGRSVSAGEPASNDTEAWMNHLQWLHLLEGRMRKENGVGVASRQRTKWADWLVPPPPPTSRSVTAAGNTEKEENEAGGSDVRGCMRSLQAYDVGAGDGRVDASVASGIDVCVDIPDRADLSATAAAAGTSETAETAMNSPRSAKSSSSSSTPSWVMANGSSTDSSSASSAPSSFEVTPLLDEDNRAAGAHNTSTILVSASSPSPSSFEAAASMGSESSVSNDDGSDGATDLKKRVGHDDEDATQVEVSSSSASHRVLAAIMRELDLAEKAVAEARQTLIDKGFSQPSPGHMLQVLLQNEAGESEGRGEAENPGKTPTNAGRSRMRGHGGTAPAPSVFLASVALSLTGDTTSVGEPNGSRKLADAPPTSTSQPGSGDDAGDVESWFGVVDGDKEAIGSWGFRDSGFCLESDRADGEDPYVVMRGNRYGVCGRPLRGLLPFVREAVAVPISAHGRARRAASPPPPSLPPSRLLLKPIPASVDAGHGYGHAASSVDGLGIASTTVANGAGGKNPGGVGWAEEEEGQPTRTLLASMVEAMGPGFDCKEQVSFSRQERARHGAGHGLLDICSLRSGHLRRAPDAVVWPTSEEEVSRLMEWAGQEDVCLIPFGGGTSVTRALEVPPLEEEPRPVVSVDMRKMCRVLAVDVANGTAHIQAGVVGRTMAKELAERGVTMGHEPDSLEFSTLGGWVATRASGMKRGRYGNIEDMVLEVRVVTGRGLAWQHSDRADNRPKAAGAFSRTSVGLDLTTAMLGSEGCLGIITSVVVKVVPLPAVSEHASFLFKDFPTGVAFCKEISRCSSRIGLASCRLLDNRQLRLGKAMKGEEDGAMSGFRATLMTLVPKAQSAYIRIWKGWESTETSAVTMVFEGSRQEADLQRSEVSRIARFHGGLSGGANAGKSGYDLTFAIAYLRDFALLFDVLGESFETFVSWTALEGLCEKVRKRVRREHRKRGLRGDAFVTHRVTQLYPEGACVYFYLAIYAQGVVNPTGVFAELEEAARDEILLAGGSLSHHHGIGKSRAGFLSRVSSPVMSDLILGMKRALDPHNVLGARNHLLAAKESSADGESVP
eukprot:g3241.t2